MSSFPEWVTEANFKQVQRIATRHEQRCPLRLAIVTGNPEHVCNCDGKLNRFGEPKTKPRERTLEDVRLQVVP